MATKVIRSEADYETAAPALLVHGGVSSLMTAAYDGRAAARSKRGSARV